MEELVSNTASTITPTNKLIAHWFPIYGFSNSGNTIRNADSVAGAGLSWGGGVQPFNNISSTTLVYAMSDRGVVW